MTSLEILKGALDDIERLLTKIAQQDEHPEYGYAGALGACNARAHVALIGVETAKAALAEYES